MSATQAELPTDRLASRPCAPSDAAHVAALFGEPGIRRWIAPAGATWQDGDPPRVAARLAAHWQAHGWGQRLWFDGGAFVGIAGLQFAIVGGRGAVEIALAILPGMQRRGYAHEAVGAILAEAPAITRVVRAAVVRGNAASMRLLTAHGFRPAGTARDAGRTLDILERETG